MSRDMFEEEKETALRNAEELVRLLSNTRYDDRNFTELNGIPSCLRTIDEFTDKLASTLDEDGRIKKAS